MKTAPKTGHDDRRYVLVPESNPGGLESLYCQTHERMEPIAPGRVRFPEGVVDHPGIYADLQGEPFVAYTCQPESAR